MPDKAGPISRPKLKLAEFKLTALGISVMPTISDVKLCRTGLSTASATPSAKARAITCQIFTLWVTTSKPKISEVNPAAKLVDIKTLRLLNRSASAPPGRLTNQTGANCNAVIIPRYVPL